MIEEHIRDIIKILLDIDVSNYDGILHYNDEQYKLCTHYNRFEIQRIRDSMIMLSYGRTKKLLKSFNDEFRIFSDTYDIRIERNTGSYINLLHINENGDIKDAFNFHEDEDKFTIELMIKDMMIYLYNIYNNIKDICNNISLDLYRDGINDTLEILKGLREYDRSISTV